MRMGLKYSADGFSRSCRSSLWRFPFTQAERSSVPCLGYNIHIIPGHLRLVVACADVFGMR